MIPDWLPSLPGRIIFLWLFLCASTAWSAQSLAQQKVKVTDVELVGFIEHPKHGVLQWEAVQIVTRELKARRYLLTLDELNLIADQITLYLREHGYQFSYAYLPQQNLANEVLRIQVVQGTLGDIQILNTDNAHLRETLHDAVADLLGQPLYAPELEYRMRELKRDPRLGVFGYYSRGAEPGDARLNLRVESYEPWRMNIQADNYGVPTTGEYRTIIQLSRFNPLQRLDQLTVGALQAIGEDSTERNTYGYLSYESPLWNSSNRLLVSAGNNLFQVGGNFGALELEGDATIAQTNFTHHMQPSGLTRQSWGIGAQHKATDMASALHDPLLEQDETVTGVQVFWRLQGVGPRGHWQYSIGAGLHGGEFEIDSITDGRESYRKTDFSMSTQWQIATEHRLSCMLSGSLRGQWSSNALPVSEKAALSGAFAVRSIDAGFFAADRLALATLEWRLPRLLNGSKKHRWQWTPLILVDGGYGERLQSDQLQDRAHTWGAGAGLEIQGWKLFTARILGLELIESNTRSGIEPHHKSLLAEAALAF